MFIYVLPIDSQYFNPKIFSLILKKIIGADEENRNVLLKGDLNVPFGITIQPIGFCMSLI